MAQESAVTALLNLSLEELNRSAITAAGAIKPLVYALRTGTAPAKQNAACALLSLSGIEENRATIGTCGAIPPLVALLSAGSTRGKKVRSPALPVPRNAAQTPPFSSTNLSATRFYV